jgi:hypothetical protein
MAGSSERDCLKLRIFSPQPQVSFITADANESWFFAPDYDFPQLQ